MRQNASKTAAAGRLLGYARVSKENQDTDPQRKDTASYAAVSEERASGADSSS